MNSGPPSMLEPSGSLNVSVSSPDRARGIGYWTPSPSEPFPMPNETSSTLIADHVSSSVTCEPVQHAVNWCELLGLPASTAPARARTRGRDAAVGPGLFMSDPSRVPRAVWIAPAY